tara:strand:+ start:3920 stop:4696 length:777 start_codon:yes stop_codon:yes gene_type:complete
MTKNKRPKITVMVSIYESGDWLENRINNLLSSTMVDDIEICCVNANSPDERDHKISKKFGNKIKYERLDQRISVYATWNHIIKNSDSEYIVSANTDDLTAPTYHKRLSTLLDKHSDIDFAYPSWLVTSVENQKWPPKKSTRDGLPGCYNGDITTAGVGHFPMWRRSLHDKLGHFDEEFKALSDAEWWARCYYLADSKFQWVSEFNSCYLWRDGQNLWSKEITKAEWKLYFDKVRRHKKTKLKNSGKPSKALIQPNIIK